MREKPLILLADDEEVFLEIASQQLEPHFSLIKTHGAEEAFVQAEIHVPDLVLSDVYMPPGPNGWELVLALRENPKTSKIPFAFFTTLRDPWVELRRNKKEVAHILGNVSIFSKIDDVENLASEIHRLIYGEKND